MLSLFIPNLILKNVNEISLSVLEKLNVKALLIDVDNTLAQHGSPDPFEGSIEWTKMLKAADYKLVIISNNYNRRVKTFAAKYDLPFVSFAMKPLPFCFNKAKKFTKIKDLKSKECLVIGDQIFTDIIGANISGMKSVLLEPVSKEKGIFLGIKRKIDEYLREKIKSAK